MSERRFLSEALSDDQLESLADRVVAHLAAGRETATWAELRPLLRAQRHQRAALEMLATLVEEEILPYPRRIEILTAIHEAHATDEEVLELLGGLLDTARDTSLLNAPPPAHPLFLTVADALAARSAQPGASSEVLSALATAARMVARQRDADAERACRLLIERSPQNPDAHYNLGLLLKTRGRFREGREANQTAARLQDTPDEATQWNLGICATGAGEGALALEVWRGLGQQLETGRFGLPEGTYPACKVLLARRPLAERTAAEDDPGLEESVWIERLSPCHGIIRSVLLQDLGVEYGDVVLFDGSPVTVQTYQGEQLPVFPHLATLARRHYRLFAFTGLQRKARQLSDLTSGLPHDAVVYPLTENVVQVCERCFRDGAAHDHDTGEAHAVSGKIAAPPDLPPHELLSQLDACLAPRAGCHLFSPDLCEAAGLPERAAVERRRLAMLNPQDA